MFRNHDYEFNILSNLNELLMVNHTVYSGTVSGLMIDKGGLIRIEESEGEYAID